MRKVILTTGGTGGHIFPAIAVAEVLKDMFSGIKILFIGSNYGPEAKIAAENGLDFRGLTVRGLLGRGPKAIPAAFNLVKALFAARKIIEDFKPEAVAAFGGYASFAPALAAKTTGTPLLVHEQNALCGASNKILSRVADVFCVSQPDTLGARSDAVLTGNPVRAQIRRKNGFSNEKRLLVIGGSQGARGINNFIAANLPVFKKAGVKIWWQCGENDYESLSKLRDGDPSWRLTPFIANMGDAYDWADLAVSRAGATSVAELVATGLPAILVPFPAAIRDHQTLNARSLENRGAAIMIKENDLDAAVAERVAGLIKDTAALENMALATASESGESAARRIAAQIVKLTEKK